MNKRIFPLALLAVLSTLTITPLLTPHREPLFAIQICTQYNIPSMGCSKL